MTQRGTLRAPHRFLLVGLRRGGTPARGAAAWALCAGLLLAAAAGCRKPEWVLGRWAYVDDDGKPVHCHEFLPDHQFRAYLSVSCAGPTDALLSGKWKLLEEDRLAILRGPDAVAQVARLVRTGGERFKAQGALSGSFHRLEGTTTDASALLARLESEGVVKLRPLDDAHCQRLDATLDSIRALPPEPKPRMIRARDQSLEYHVAAAGEQQAVSKVVYAVNQDQLDWVAFQLGEAAFAPPGPEARMEQALGRPEQTLVTGQGLKRQSIVMWQTYCRSLHGALNKNVDVTLFATPGERQGLFYVSEGLLPEVWPELKQTVGDPALQATEEELAEAEAAKAATAAESKTPAAAAPPAPAPAARPATAPARAAQPAPAPNPAPPPASAGSAKPPAAEAPPAAAPAPPSAPAPAPDNGRGAHARPQVGGTDDI